MSSNLGTPTSREWHDLLSENDLAVRTAEDARVRAQSVSELGARLAAATAELRALRAAVVVRDTLLHEQSVALHERDEQLHALATAAVHDDPRRLSRLPRRALSFARRSGARVWSRFAG